MEEPKKIYKEVLQIEVEFESEYPLLSHDLKNLAKTIKETLSSEISENCDVRSIVIIKS